MIGPAESRFRALVERQITVDEFLDLSLEVQMEDDGRVRIHDTTHSWLRAARDGRPVGAYIAPFETRMRGCV